MKLITLAFILLAAAFTGRAPRGDDQGSASGAAEMLALGRNDEAPWRLVHQDPDAVRIEYGPGVRPPDPRAPPPSALFATACNLVRRGEPDQHVSWLLDLTQIVDGGVAVGSSTVVYWRWKYVDRIESDAVVLTWALSDGEQSAS